MNNTQADRLRSLVAEVARKAFQKFRDAHPGETFYKFGLATDWEFLSVEPVANTEEQLLKMSHGYAKTPLRWSIGDCPDCVDYEDRFDEKIQEIQEILDGDRDSDSLEVPPEELCTRDEKRYEQIVSIYEQVLRQLDKEGCFGIGSARSGVVVNLFFYDQSYEGMVDLASRLNPPQVVERYRFELAFCKEWPPEVDITYPEDLSQV